MVVLKRSIVARKNEHRKHVIKYMEENVKLLHDYSDANQNVRNLAYHIKALQVNPNSKNLKFYTSLGFPMLIFGSNLFLLM